MMTHEYGLTIKALYRTRCRGYGYFIEVTREDTDKRLCLLGGVCGTGYAYTKWGAHRKAKKIVRDNELGSIGISIGKEYEI